MEYVGTRQNFNATQKQWRGGRLNNEGIKRLCTKLNVLFSTVLMLYLRTRIGIVYQLHINCFIAQKVVAAIR